MGTLLRKFLDYYRFAVRLETCVTWEIRKVRKVRKFRKPAIKLASLDARRTSGELWSGPRVSRLNIGCRVYNGQVL